MGSPDSFSIIAPLSTSLPLSLSFSAPPHRCTYIHIIFKTKIRSYYAF